MAKKGLWTDRPQLTTHVQGSPQSLWMPIRTDRSNWWLVIYWDHRGKVWSISLILKNFLELEVTLSTPVGLPVIS
jgi:hypothetical protein